MKVARMAQSALLRLLWQEQEGAFGDCCWEGWGGSKMKWVSWAQRQTCLQIGMWEEKSLPSQNLSLTTVELKAGILSAVSCQMCLRRHCHFPPLASLRLARQTILTSKRKLQEVSVEWTLALYDHWLSKGNGRCPSVHNLYESSGNQGFDFAWLFFHASYFITIWPG